METNTLFDKNIIILIVVLLSLLLLVILATFCFVRGKRNQLTKIYKQKTISMEEILTFFKQDQNLKVLKENPNLLACVIREKLKNGKVKLVLTLFDTKTNEIIWKDFGSVVEYRLDFLPEEIVDEFNDKDLLVLR